ncbi:hypothetical protein TNCV_2437411 [Trichonephila clavipes]|nr:hypothetical protein TNCV_2437411 [Trichonephila clavipes]
MFIESVVDKSVMLTITVQHISYEVQLQRTLLFHPLAVGEDSLPDSKLVLTENGRGEDDYRLPLYTNGLMTHTYVMSNSSCI